jgi:hypothetical protein
MNVIFKARTPMFFHSFPPYGLCGGLSRLAGLHATQGLSVWRAGHGSRAACSGVVSLDVPRPALCTELFSVSDSVEIYMYMGGDIQAYEIYMYSRRHTHLHAQDLMFCLVPYMCAAGMATCFGAVLIV